jgi:hypothetical protein
VPAARWAFDNVRAAHEALELLAAASTVEVVEWHFGQRPVPAAGFTDTPT